MDAIRSLLILYIFEMIKKKFSQFCGSTASWSGSTGPSVVLPPLPEKRISQVATGQMPTDSSLVVLPVVLPSRFYRCTVRYFRLLKLLARYLHSFFIMKITILMASNLKSNTWSSSDAYGQTYMNISMPTLVHKDCH